MFIDQTNVLEELMRVRVSRMTEREIIDRIAEDFITPILKPHMPSKTIKKQSMFNFSVPFERFIPDEFWLYAAVTGLTWAGGALGSVQYAAGVIYNLYSAFILRETIEQHLSFLPSETTGGFNVTVGGVSVNTSREKMVEKMKAVMQAYHSSQTVIDTYYPGHPGLELHFSLNAVYTFFGVNAYTGNFWGVTGLVVPSSYFASGTFAAGPNVVGYQSDQPGIVGNRWESSTGDVRRGVTQFDKFYNIFDSLEEGDKAIKLAQMQSVVDMVDSNWGHLFIEQGGRHTANIWLVDSKNRFEVSSGLTREQVACAILASLEDETSSSPWWIHDSWGGGQIKAGTVWEDENNQFSYTQEWQEAQDWDFYAASFRSSIDVKKAEVTLVESVYGKEVANGLRTLYRQLETMSNEDLFYLMYKIENKKLNVVDLVWRNPEAFPDLAFRSMED